MHSNPEPEDMRRQPDPAPPPPVEAGAIPPADAAAIQPTEPSASSPAEADEVAGPAEPAGDPLTDSPGFPRGEPPAASPDPPAATELAPASSRGIRRSLVALVVATALVVSVASSAATYILLSSSPAEQVAAARSSQAVTGILTSSSQSLVDAVKKAQASVVTIDVTASGGPFGQQVSGAGTGIIVSSNGLILTNAHVVSGASSIQVTLPDGTKTTGTVYGISSTTDLAIVKVNATGLTPATLRTGSLAVGETVLAIGDPLGEFADSVSAGIVSGLNRSITVENENLTGLIQTDASVNGGNSGGPLVDANGNVVGVVTASSGSAQGISFAIPISAATQLIAQADSGQAIR